MASSASRGNSKSPPSNLKVSERPLTLIKTIGEKGSGDGQFDNPTSLAVTAEGDIVVADRNNSRLQFLSKDGSFKKKVDLEFQPWCVAVMPVDGYYPKKLLVTGDGPMIHALDEQGMKSGVIQVTGDVEADETTEGIAVDSLGYIFVTIRNKVFRRDPLRHSSHTFKLWSKGQFGSSLRVTAKGNNQIIVSDFVNHSLKIFKYDDTVATSRCPYVVTPRLDAIKVLNLEIKRPDHVKLDCPWSVITDGDDIIVTDYQNHCVSVFNQKGKFTKRMLTQEDGGLNYPMGLALTHDGHLVVSDMHSVKMFGKSKPKGTHN